MGKRNVRWKHEALILAVDCYFQVREEGRRLRASDPKAKQLSKQISALKLHDSTPDSPSFRSPDAVAMQVNGFAVHDQHSSFEARATGGSKSKQVWETYSSRPEAASAMAATVLEAFGTGGAQSKSL